MEQKIKQQLEDIFNEGGFYNIHKEYILGMMLKAYELGKSSKKCKEDNDNPYHIDYKRQTKLFDDEKN